MEQNQKRKAFFQFENDLIPEETKQNQVYEIPYSKKTVDKKM